MSDYQRLQFERWVVEHLKGKVPLEEVAWAAYQAGWEAGIENYQDGEWDYE